MSQKPISEYSGKRLIKNWLEKHEVPKEFKTIENMIVIRESTNLDEIEKEMDQDEELKNKKFIVKPDQLIKRRGKLNLVQLNLSYKDCLKWIKNTRGNELKIGEAKDTLKNFLIEPFIIHDHQEEHYICIRSIREGDEILFYHQGGIDIGDADSKSNHLKIPINDEIDEETIINSLLQNIHESKRNIISKFILLLYRLYCELHFVYLEINPLVVLNHNCNIYIIDLAAKLDSAAEFQCHSLWNDIVEFPSFFGHQITPEEQYIEELDDRTGSSLKLTVLNPKGRVWTMVAGGGASVIYADTIADLGFADELGNYGEYSGAPTQALTYQYASTIIKLCLRYPHEKGKILIIGGGIANFTDVADTFKGVIQALHEHKNELKDKQCTIYIRRGGPNYQEGLKLMKQCGIDCELDMHVFGPETHITAIVSMALLGRNISGVLDNKELSKINKKDMNNKQQSNDEIKESGGDNEDIADLNVEASMDKLDISHYKWNKDWEDAKDQNPNSYNYVMTDKTRAIVYGMQTQAVQNMLDFDYISRRKTPSVACIVYTFASGTNHQQFYWGSKEIMIPVYRSLKESINKHPEVDTIVNFASSRSAYSSTVEMLEFPSIKHITIIAEGVPERHTRHLIRRGKELNKIILGPATVGGIKPGCFRIGNTGGRLDNIIDCKLHRPGSVAFVSRSGGLSNELSNIIARTTDGVLEGMAIGGDRYPITTFMENILRYQRDPKCKIIVLLGEVGGILEYEVCEALKNNLITKPLIAWCTGTCAKCFKYEVQFGHAGALANSQSETAWAKNEALAKAGAIVPDSFDNFARLIKFLFNRLRRENIIEQIKEIEPPPIPLDYSWARKLGLIRKPSGFLSSISDERGEELVYAGMPISQVLEQDLGVGGVVGLLWFRRRLPDYACRFIELVLMVTADHGPAVSGAHNTIVTARAGKDLVSSLCSGLLTIGPRFGGALDDAAKMFTDAFDRNLTATEFVKETQQKGILIMGIGHKIKSLENPDKRVQIVVNYVKEHFPSCKILDFGLQVQEITTRKKSTLILNVDGAIACGFVDLLRTCKSFSKEEADSYIQMGCLNALFVLGRSIGFIGHFLDQKRLGQQLYRHPTDDITYFMHDLPSPSSNAEE